MRQEMNRLMEDYASFHTHPLNRLTHEVAIPLIVFHVVAMLDWVELGSWSIAGHGVTLAHVVMIFPLLWYAWMAPRMAPLVILPMLLCLPLGRITPVWLVVVIAIVAWAIQFAGHVIWEKRSPAFFGNLVHLLVGPIFFVAIATGAWPRARGQQG
jgi:uncharacterized membrane protein YGL010W